MKYEGAKSHKMPKGGKVSSNKKASGGDKSAGVPTDKSASMAMQSGYGKARVKGSDAKEFC